MREVSVLTGSVIIIIMKKIILGVVIGLLLIGGGVYALTANKAKIEKQEKVATVETKDELEVNDEQPADSDKKADASINQGSYVTLSEYNKEPIKYADTKVVYFFHANWCPICRSIDEDISSDISQIPNGVTFVKTDFDSSIELRQKYGVTYQYTFVQVDASGDETAQWSASSLDAAIAGIKS